jgi:hypothetical protein
MNLQEQKNYYKKVGEKNLESTLSYYKSNNLKYDLGYELEQKRIWAHLVSDDIVLEAQNRDYQPVFITLTLPSQFHNFKKRADSYVYNNRYNNLSHKDGYRLLNVIHRDLTANYFVKRKRVKLLYIKVIETHKDLTAHAHLLVFIPRHSFVDFKKHFKKITAKYSLVYSRQDIQDKSEVKKTATKEDKQKQLEKEKTISAYITKYITKSHDTEAILNYDSDDYFIQKGYMISNKVREFTYSKTSCSRENFKQFNKFIKFDENSSLSYLAQIATQSIVITNEKLDDSDFTLAELRSHYKVVKVYSVSKIASIRSKKTTKLNLDRIENRDMFESLFADRVLLEDKLFNKNVNEVIYFYDKLVSIRKSEENVILSHTLS